MHKTYSKTKAGIVALCDELSQDSEDFRLFFSRSWTVLACGCVSNFCWLHV